MAAGAAQTFVFGLTPNGAMDDWASPRFLCDNLGMAPLAVGVNGFNLTATNSALPDIIMVVATTSGDGVLRLPGRNGSGFVSVAAINIGSPGTVDLIANDGEDVGTIPVPLNGYSCETTDTGAILECGTPSEPGLTRSFATGQIRYFTLFIQAVGEVIPYDPANRRAYVGFNTATFEEFLVGATSVAVTTE